MYRYPRSDGGGREQQYNISDDNRISGARARANHRPPWRRARETCCWGGSAIYAGHSGCATTAVISCITHSDSDYSVLTSFRAPRRPVDAVDCHVRPLVDSVLFAIWVPCAPLRSVRARINSFDSQSGVRLPCIRRLAVFISDNCGESIVLLSVDVFFSNATLVCPILKYYNIPFTVRPLR